MLTKIANIYDGGRKKAWLIASLSGLRSELYYYYKPKMNLIRVMRKNKDYSRLSLLLEKNMQAIKTGLDCDLGFAVNRELYEIQLETLRGLGKVELAEKLEQITPEKYMNSIVGD